VAFIFLSDYHRTSASTLVPCVNQLIVLILYQRLTCEQVIPAKAGIQARELISLDSGFRRNNGKKLAED